MRHYIGIDLGTTNSAICSFDGTQTRVWKSPEQSDVTPSVIYVNKKGHRFFGRKAFEMASGNEKNAAALFKRYLGTSKTYHLADADVDLTPVECSAQLLKVLFGYLSEEIRNDPETVTVITVPAAFNQMKKDATLEAARLAGIGNTALMQEPVAAVMSVLKKDDAEKLFLVYDLGGGTFDISVARFVGGHVSLLAQGGREMCGGRDMDRWIYYREILPWLREQFTLPEDPDASDKYVEMKRAALFAVEEAKIALSGAQEAQIWMDEETLQVCDEAGREIYLDLQLTRQDLEPLINQMAQETVELTRETMQKAGVTGEHVDQIVFVGGPTMYAPLRDAVCALLGIEKGTAVNPMTAVAEGASIYAESIDWENAWHRPKESVEEVPEEDSVLIRYESRTPLQVGKIAILVSDGKMRTVRIQSASAFDSGRVSVVGSGVVEVPLPEAGTYTFTVTIEDSEGNEPDVKTIEITRILASIESIPASHSIAVKALDRPGGVPVPVYLVEANDPLPRSGTMTFRAAQQLVGGSAGALVFTLWEGEIRDPVDDNRYIGTYRIPGNSFSGGIIPVGAEVICDYEMNEAGNLRLGVSIPCVGLRMEDQNFYSRFEGQVDLQDTFSLISEVNELLERTAQMKMRIVDEELDEVRKTLLELRNTLSSTSDQESIARAESDLMDCYRRVAMLHQRYANVIKSHDLQRVLEEFETVRDKATSDETASFQNLTEAARYSIDLGSSDFESQLLEMRRRIGSIRWRQDGYVRLLFSRIIQWPGDFEDRAAFDHLKAEGLTCLENNDCDTLRRVINDLAGLSRKKKNLQAEKMFAEVNIYRG